jgi:uroporphyrinogen decarboxylase
MTKLLSKFAAGSAIPFSPGIYEHAAALIGENPWKVSQDADLLHRAQNTAWQRYGHPMVVAGIDVYNVEAEAMGAGLDRPAGSGVPSIVAHPFSSVEALLRAVAPDPSVDGRMPMILAVARRLTSACGASTVFVPLCGPLALANGLVGMDEVLCTMMEEPDLVREALVRLSENHEGYVRAILEAGARPLIFESGASPPLLPPSLFSEIEAPALGRLFSVCREAGEPAPACILGGDALPILPALAALSPGFVICPSETDQAGFVETAAAYPQISVRINLPVAALLESDWQKITRLADGAIALARRLPHGSVGTGVVPFDTDPDLLLRLRDYVQQIAPGKSSL